MAAAKTATEAPIDSIGSSAIAMTATTPSLAAHGTVPTVSAYLGLGPGLAGRGSSRGRSLAQRGCQKHGHRAADPEVAVAGFV